MLSIARKFDRVFIVYDDDSATSNAGQRFTLRMSELLTQNRIPFVVGTVPTPYHDVSEYYAAGGDLSKLITAAEPGIQYIASRFTDFESLETYIYSIARHTKRSAMDSLLEHLLRVTNHDAKRLISLFKSATSAPPENIVADEILRDHNLVYVHAVGFYEYFGGLWNRLEDGIIGGYVDRAYGEFSTNQRVKAVTGLLKIRALRNITFNTQPVWNFINGTLELDTGVFREHNPNDYCSFQADYPYNPDATFSAWEKFIDDVTAGDPKKAELLQFIPAYVLMPHCKFEKVFCLTGSGGNGKSKYLEIIRRLFGDENVTNITPRGLLDRFQRISLRDALLNIAGEIKSGLHDVEEYIKLIASGEPLSACYKSQDFVNFISRVKLLFAMNGQLSSGDTSDGLTRRLVIVDFVVSFVDFPDPDDPFQRLKDVDIIEKLTAELNSGGIFNWVYAGYKLLNAVGYFTETNDQAELLQEFKRASNPVLRFYEETEIPETIDNTTLYGKYKQWCIDSGEVATSSISFHREFKRVSKTTFEPYRTSKERGYRRKFTVNNQ